jgi:hypothetical protein
VLGARGADRIRVLVATERAQRALEHQRSGQAARVRDERTLEAVGSRRRIAELILEETTQVDERGRALGGERGRPDDRGEHGRELVVVALLTKQSCEREQRRAELRIAVARLPVVLERTGGVIEPMLTERGELVRERSTQRRILFLCQVTTQGRQPRVRGRSRRGD